MTTITIFAGDNGHSLIAINGHNQTYYGVLHVKQDNDKTRLYLADIKTPYQELSLPNRRYHINSPEFERDVLAAIAAHEATA
jgi:hypothetical protein